MTASRAAAPDGSAGALYRALPTTSEHETIRAALPARCDILELGAGGGRLTRELVRHGHRVLAVDAAPQSLRSIRDADRVCARVDALPFATRFAAVLLTNNLVNVPDAFAREAFISACARHVAPGGVIVMQRLDPGWARAIDAEPSRIGELEVRVRRAGSDAGAACATVEYRLGTGPWQHRFTASILDDEQLDALLARHGMRRAAWLDAQKSWLSVVDASAHSKRARRGGK